MQVVADADESESFFKKFADTRGAEEEDAENDVVFTCLLNQLLGCGFELGRGVHVRKFVFVIEPHRHAEIVLAEKENVDAGDGGDLGDVLDAGSGLDLQRYDALAVPFAGIAEQSVAVHTALWKVDGARAHGGIFRATYGLARFVRCVDVGDEHSVGTHVESLLDAGAVIVSADCDNRRRVGRRN